MKFREEKKLESGKTFLRTFLGSIAIHTYISLNGPLLNVTYVKNFSG